MPEEGKCQTIKSLKKKKKRKNTKKPVYPEQRVIMSKTVYRMSKEEKLNDNER